jgi:hypothetical protein
LRLLLAVGSVPRKVCRRCAMSRVSRILRFGLVALIVGELAFAQFGQGNADKFERVTKVDGKGMVQWAEHVPAKCPSCTGTGKTKCTTCADFEDPSSICPDCKRTKDQQAVCRACAGAGSVPDPLEKALCPTCLGAAFLLCTLCNGAGKIKVDDDKKWSDCPGCRGQGGFKCGTCNGDRLVALAALKPSLRDADAASLADAIAATEQSLKTLGAFVPAPANTRKSAKALAKALESAHRFHPALKRAPKVVEDYMGKIFMGEDFTDHETDEVAAMDLVKGNAVHYLTHQERMLELAHDRAKTNARLAAEGKGK